MAKILLIESDFKSQIKLKCILMYKGFSVTLCPDLTHARAILEQDEFELILIDIHNQNESAFYFVKGLRLKGCFTPVLYLGERSYEEVLQKNSTNLDDFLMNPFNISELNLMVHKVLLKSYSPQKPLLYSGIRIDEKKRILSVKEKAINLGNMEMRILNILAQKAGKIVTLEYLYKLVDQEGVQLTRIFSYISSLRKKLEDAGVESLKINFVKDGYRLDVL